MCVRLAAADDRGRRPAGYLLVDADAELRAVSEAALGAAGELARINGSSPVA